MPNRFPLLTITVLLLTGGLLYYAYTVPGPRGCDTNLPTYTVISPDGTLVTEADLAWLPTLAESLDTDQNMPVLSQTLSALGAEAAYAKIHESFAVAQMYDTLAPELEAIAIISPGGNVYVDTRDKQVFPAPEDAHVALPFHEGVAPVGTFARGGEDGTMAMTFRYINREGKTVLPGPFERALPFVDGVATVAVRNESGDTKYGAIDRTGAWKIPPTFDQLFEFSDGLAAAQIDNPDHTAKKAGFINLEGEWIITLDEVQRMKSSHHDGLALVWRTEAPEYIFVDRQGKVALTPEYDQVEPFFEGRAAVLEGESWGYINTEGTEVIAPRYYHVLPFHGGLTAVVEVPEGYEPPDHATFTFEYEE